MSTYEDIAAYQAVTQRAQAAAQAAYNQALARGQDQNTALEWAKFQWQQKMDESTQTGMWNGQWSNPQEQWFTGQFGQWYGPGGAPQAGDLTQAAQQQQFGQANTLSGMYGQYYAPGGQTPYTGQQTGGALNAAQQAALNEANVTGYYNAPSQTNIDPNTFGNQDQATQQYWLQWNGNDPQKAAQQWAAATSASLRDYAAKNPEANRQQTLAGQQQQFSQNLQTEQEARAAQAQQQSQAQSYLSLLSSLRGPADWAKYQQVLGSTPGGMRDLVAAAMGQYVPGGGATTGMAPQAVSLQSLMGDVSGSPYMGAGGGQLGQPSVYSYNPAVYGQQGQAGGTQQWAVQPGQVNTAGMWSGPKSGAAWDQYQAQQQAQNAQGPQFQTQTWGSGIGVGSQQATPQQQQQGLGSGTNLPAPNQISAQSWRNMAPSQQQMLLGMYEGQGWNKDDVTALMNQSLPKYASNYATAGTWRMQ